MSVVHCLPFLLMVINLVPNLVKMYNYNNILNAGIQTIQYLNCTFILTVWFLLTYSGATLHFINFSFSSSRKLLSHSGMFPSFSLVNTLETKKSSSFAALCASSVIRLPPSITPGDYSLPSNPPDPYLFVQPFVCPSTIE